MKTIQAGDGKQYRLAYRPVEMGCVAMIKGHTHKCNEGRIVRVFIPLNPGERYGHARRAAPGRPVLAGRGHRRLHAGVHTGARRGTENRHNCGRAHGYLAKTEGGAMRRVLKDLLYRCIVGPVLSVMFAYDDVVRWWRNRNKENT